ncbi:MAG: ArsB/NhaD family transporter [Candidatus Omnitrophica bacterium]|nr:ArsB/NhaD family transporter [Candidatus Omnitrophota bacterium]
MIIAILIFVAVYILILTEKIDKTIIAMFGAFAMMITGVLPYEIAVKAIDFNVIFLLTGMMICVSVLSKTGFFEWVAISVAKLTRGNPLLILVFFTSLTAFLSAFLDNVTTMILLAPVTILVAQLLEISAIPFLILEAIASNIGGAATLIGDPPNIIIGSKANLSFNDFLFNLGPVIFIVFGAFLVTVFFIFRKRWSLSENIKKRVIESVPRLAIVDKKRMIKALLVLSLVFIGFFFHDTLNLRPGIIAIVGGMLMLIICKSGIDENLMKVEWAVIFFFIGLFMVIAGLEHQGVLELFAKTILRLSGDNLFFITALVLCSSAVLSAFLDNIPFVMTMIPVIQDIVNQFALQQQITSPEIIHFKIGYPLWWALALGACLGGNGSLIGASANVLVAKIGEKNRNRITFIRFFKYGFPLMVESIIICLGYLWLRYFFLAKV